MKNKIGVVDIEIPRETLIAKFRIHGNLRFLSHHETVRLIQRALIRSGVKLVFSQGFNPRPRLSLPLPRSVGVSCDDELFYAGIVGDTEEKTTASELQQSINKQLPGGCEITSVEIAKDKVSLQPVSVVYTLAVSERFGSEQTKAAVKQLNEKIRSGESMVVERQIDKKGRSKQVDVGVFVEQAEMADEDITVRCKTGPGGSIRPAEILTILGIGSDMLAGAIKRSNVQWKRN